jgi:hypothetical protein
MKSKFLVLVAILALALWVAPASAVTQTFPIAGSLDNLPVSGVAEFNIDTTAQTITIGIWNTQANPTAVIQCISDLKFDLTDGNTSGTLASSSGVERTVFDDGTFSVGPTVSTGWVLTDGGGNYYLNGLGAATFTPAHTIIGAPDGSNLYSNANASITTDTNPAPPNNPHDPFLFAATRAGATTFVLDFTGLTDDTRVANVRLSFGTTSGREVPIPPSVLLLGSGLLGLGVLRFRRS